MIRTKEESSSGEYTYDSESDDSVYMASDAGDSEISDNIAAMSHKTYKTNKTFKTNMTGKKSKRSKRSKTKK